ncbi:hypothetical protein MTR67_032634 [Solanum verrucosum]|uniref:Integrase catalytic domain-containing protein n=1 Tax=Solanum verrucosum TaxID=315347 RepID=A0AAF0U4S9_SOLVR|nr:hypothetical protein MTR67_032634 [Solanum verrucosum]
MQTHDQHLQLERWHITPALAKTQPLLPTPQSRSIVPARNNPNALSRVPVKRLSPTEMQQRREKGLCYYCDEKYTTNHRCKTLPRILLLEDDLDTLLSATEQLTSDEMLAEELHALEMQAHFTIFYHALSGGHSLTILRFKGYVRGSPVVILLDGGSTHNFIQPRLANFLNFVISPTTNFSVVVGNGQRLRCEGVVQDVPISIQGTDLLMDLYVLAFHEADVIFGVSWLATLGLVLTDHSTCQMEFYLDGKQVKWVGNLPDELQPAQLQMLRRYHTTDAVAACFCLFMVHDDATIIDVIPLNLEILLESYYGVFNKPQEVPPARDTDHAIHLQPQVGPVNVKLYRYPYFQKQIMEQLVSEMALNAITVRDRFPIPSIDELFDELHGAQFFSKMDLLAGYHHIRVRPIDIPKTVFRTHDGHYEFLVMPFGLLNAPSTFQATMNDIFRPYLRKFVLVFFDDILIYSSTWTLHLERLELSKVDYLGHVITSTELAVDPFKIDAIQQWATPKSIKEVRSFLGFAGYYRRFIIQFATIASPLSDLLKNNGFQWTNQAQQAFEELKCRLSSTPVLALPNFDEDFHLETDVSGVGIGAILSQRKHPVAFYSQKLCPRMQKASTYHKEMYVITQAVAKWRQYLLGRRFTIFTDQQSLKNLTNQMIQTLKQQKWLDLQRFKDRNQLPASLLQPLSIPYMGFEEITMDFITCLPSSKGKTTIITVVDRLSKYGHFIPLPSTFSAHIVAQAFVIHIIKLYGPPRTIVTDRDPRFLHTFWQEINRLQGTILAMSTSYHQQIDGQSEALNKCVEQYLRCFVADSPHEWVHMLPWTVFWYNTPYQTSTGMTPFQALYGREPPNITIYVLGSTSDDLIDKYMLRRDEGQPDQQITLLKLHDSATPNLEDKVLFSGRSNIVNPILDSEIVGPSDLVEDFGLKSHA